MNTVLNAVRPTVKFDIKNAEHRAEATRFIKTGTWAKSKYLFALDMPFRSVSHMVREYMLMYLIDHQQKAPAKKVAAKKTAK